jgi:hypothetical protein
LLRLKNYLAERPSPSSPQEQAEPRLEAREGLDVTACSASPLSDGMVVGMIKFYDDGTYDAYGRIDQTICSLLRNQAQSTNTLSVE